MDNCTQTQPECLNNISELKLENNDLAIEISRLKEQLSRCQDANAVLRVEAAATAETYCDFRAQFEVLKKKHEASDQQLGVLQRAEVAMQEKIKLQGIELDAWTDTAKELEVQNKALQARVDALPVCSVGCIASVCHLPKVLDMYSFISPSPSPHKSPM